MNNRIPCNKRGLLSGLAWLLLIASVPLHADFNIPENAVGIDTFDTSNQLSSAGSILATARFGLSDSYTDSAELNNSAWGAVGSWYTFQNLSKTKVSITVTGDADFVPGLTVWATGAVEFNGGTTGFAGESSTAFFSTPDAFNATGAMGDPGTLWMADGQGGNVLETLAYAVANPNVNYQAADTGWGETILSGVQAVSSSDSFETGISGHTAENAVTLQFDNLAAGWYALYIGGTDTTTLGGNYDLVVSAVPEAQTWAMLLAGLGVIGWRLRQLSSDGSLAIA